MTAPTPALSPPAPPAPGTAGLLISALAIPGRPEHVQAARAFTDLVLGVHARDDDGIASLLVSELVTNSVLHSDSRAAGGTVTVTVAVTPGEVLVEVTDNGGGRGPTPREAGDDGENGRGLHLVTELSDAWGYVAANGRLTTWFELKTMEARPVNEHTCSCGYGAASAEDLGDHLAEMFTPDDDTAPDGQTHAEAAHDTASVGLSCLCGFTADATAGLDEHFARAFTPPDRIGRDGGRHARTSAGRLAGHT